MKQILIFIFSLIVVSCSTQKKVVEVPIVVEKTNTEYQNKSLRDSIFLKDSIYIHDSIYIKEKGDTIFVNKYTTKYVDKISYKYIDKHDTLIVRDSIPYQVKTTVYKDVITNKIYWWQKGLMVLGIIPICILLLWLSKKFIK